MTTRDFIARMRVEIHGPSSGGGGKSSSALDSAAIARLSGLKVMMLDADRGNAALSDSLNPKYEIKALPPRYNQDYASELVASCLHRGIDLLVIDLGANAMTDESIEAAIMKICAEARDHDCRNRVYLSLQPAKRGLATDANIFAERFADVAEVYLNFREGMDRTDFEDLIGKCQGTVTVPNYQVAIMDLLKESRLVPSDWIGEPQVGFDIAASMYAEGLLQRCREPAIRAWIGSDEAENWLTEKASKTPKRFYVGLEQRHQISNERLTASERFLNAQHALRRTDPASSDAIVAQAGREFINASQALQRIIASAS